MELASWFLAALGAIGVYISGKNKWGWAIGVLYQVLWIVYAYVTQQYGFIGVCVVYAVLYAKNFYEGGKKNAGNSDPDDGASGVGKVDLGS